MSLPSPAEVAQRDARRMALVLKDLVVDGAPVDSGWMACDIEGSWAEYASGLGEDGPVDGASLDALVDFFESRGRTPQVQVTPYQHPSLLSGLAERGFTVFEFETMLVRGVGALGAPIGPTGLTFRRVDPESSEDVSAFVESQMRGFGGNERVSDGMRPIIERVVRTPRAMMWFIELDGQIVGSGGMEVFERCGVLIGACTTAPYRGRGVQSAFIRYRVSEAAKAGLDYVTICSLAGGPTERNALRFGFQVAYTQSEFRKV